MVLSRTHWYVTLVLWDNTLSYIKTINLQSNSYRLIKMHFTSIFLLRIYVLLNRGLSSYEMLRFHMKKEFLIIQLKGWTSFLIIFYDFAHTYMKVVVLVDFISHANVSFEYMKLY